MSNTLFFFRGLPIKKDKLVNSYDVDEENNDAQSGDYTVAVVNNPLYAENEGDIDTYLKEELAGREDELEVLDSAWSRGATDVSI